MLYIKPDSGDLVDYQIVNARHNPSLNQHLRALSSPEDVFKQNVLPATNSLVDNLDTVQIDFPESLKELQRFTVTNNLKLYLTGERYLSLMDNNVLTEWEFVADYTDLTDEKRQALDAFGFIKQDFSEQDMFGGAVEVWYHKNNTWYSQETEISPEDTNNKDKYNKNTCNLAIIVYRNVLLHYQTMDIIREFFPKRYNGMDQFRKSFYLMAEELAITRNQLKTLFQENPSLLKD